MYNKLLVILLVIFGACDGPGRAFDINGAIETVLSQNWAGDRNAR